MHKLAVIKTTPKGVKLIGLQYGDKTARFVAHASKKKFACATIEEAVESFKKRKERQANIYRVKASNADKAYNIAVAGFYNTMPNWFNRKMFEETCNGN